MCVMLFPVHEELPFGESGRTGCERDTVCRRAGRNVGISTPRVPASNT